MNAVYNWKKLLRNICKEKGWEHNKNCKIKYEAHADFPTDTLTFVAKIHPYTQIEEIEIRAVIN